MRLHPRIGGRGFTALPPDIQRSLETLGAPQVAMSVAWREADRFVALTAGLEPRGIAAIAPQIARAAGLSHAARPVPTLFAGPRMVQDPAAPDAVPDLAWLFLFHRDGRMREAALRRIAPPLPTPFLAAALACRLNDWAGPVRAAARAAWARVDPAAEAAVLGGASALHGMLAQWGRIEADDRAALEETLCHPAVLAAFAERLRAEPSGRLAADLRACLRRPGLDRDLSALAAHAASPAIRAVALRAIGEGRFRWQTGWAREWVDRSMGLSRRVPLSESRPLQPAPPPLPAIATGLDDRAAPVRAAALDALIANPWLVPALRARLPGLAADRSPRVSERAGFLLRRLAGDG